MNPIEEKLAELETIPGLLTELRKKTPDIIGVRANSFGKLLIMLLEGGGTPESHGTSIEELKDLQQSVPLCQARALLDHLRADAKFPELEIGYVRDGENTIAMIRKHVTDAGLTLEDIGTNKRELGELIASKS